MEINNPETITAQIIREAEEKAESIVGKTEERAKSILDEIEKNKRDIIATTRKSAQKENQRIEKQTISLLNLQKRDILLKNKEELIQRVIQKVKESQEELRHRSEYKEKLKEMIYESILILEKDCVKILFGEKDIHLADKNFQEELALYLKEKMGKPIDFIITKDISINDIGVIVKSIDERVIFDNTFSKRLSRMKEEVRIDIYKQMFGDRE